MLLQNHIIRQIIAFFPVNLIYVSGGIGCGWVSPILNRYQNSDSDFSLDTEACSLIASLHYLGRAIGCVLIAALVNRVGRNKVFLFSATCGCIIWLAVLYTKSIPLHYVIRVLFGMGVSAQEIGTSLYIGENSSPNLRAIFGGLCSISFYLGEVLAFALGTYTSYDTIATVHMVLSIAILSSMVLLREPAQYLLSKGLGEKAEKRFFELRGNTDVARKEFEETKLSLASEKKIPFSFNLLTNKSIRIVSVVNSFHYVTGYPPINAMASLAFSSIKNLTSNELTILLGVIQLCSIPFSWCIVERIGRRPLLMMSAAACFVIHLLTAAVYYCEERGTPLPHSPWLLFAFIATYSAITAAILFPVTTTIRGELLPPQLKPIGGAAAIIINSIISIISTGLFLGVAENYGIKTNFLCFAATSLLMMMYVYFELPETKGLTLTEIQMKLQK